MAVAAAGGGLGAIGGASGAAGSTAGAGSSVSSGSGGSGSGGSASRSGGRGSESRSVRARDRDQDGVARRLARSGRQVRRLDGAVGTDCSAVSYGEVRTFFAGRPCTAVARVLFEVREGGARVVVAVAVVDMPDGDGDGARALQRLVDTHGTGNVRELRTRPPVRWTGRYYRSARSGSTVVNAQAEPAGTGRAGGRLAAAVARDAARD
ncbi:hypothetical protein [Pseudonocardia sp. HH130630-07]|uniref:hypothetical protein n=1 Tax=Pseudonocardia sp. HH130630-07 TaxID=1690815 RepID=UPI000814E97B|nr:hypothetical protein [Pseudonocardia sp. HH130630-07]ANY09264.1 hypothetical protein AFB00_26855 [Pseudonocardia sp. HH130630-07]